MNIVRRIERKIKQMNNMWHKFISYALSMFWQLVSVFLILFYLCLCTTIFCMCNKL